MVQKSRAQSRERHSSAGAGAARWLSLAALAVAFAGLFAAAVLGAGHVLDLPVPCGKSRGCLAVAAHPSSRLWGVPIAFIGVGGYLGMILLLGLSVPKRWARAVFAAMAGVGTIVSAGLLIYSRSVIGATCTWCIASGMAMMLLLVLGVGLAMIKAPIPAIGQRWLWGLAIVTAAAIGAQAGAMQRAALRPPVPPERLAGLTGAELVDSAKAVGPADAPVTIVIFGDLWCPACRASYGSLVKYQAANPQGVRLAYRHFPLWEIPGHRFSGTAAALSQIAAEMGKFWVFIEAIHSLRGQLSADGYLKLMKGLGLETEGLEARLDDMQDPAIAGVRRDMALAEQLGITATPTFIVLVEGKVPVSANQRTLAMILNSAAVQAKLLQRAGK